MITYCTHAVYKKGTVKLTFALDYILFRGRGRCWQRNPKDTISKQYIYDGSKDNLSGFDVQRDAENNLCYLTNDLITVTDARTDQVAQFECSKPDNEHNNVFWSGNSDEVNGGYSPNNDAMYAAHIINEMYQTWYQIPALTKDGKPMRLNMVTHDPEEGENASWDDIEKKMHFGDGGDEFYPLTSVGVAAHEISHGFTSQHSNLIYDGESGGMNEAFSDMADQAALFYSMGKADYMIGSELAKQDNFALRYMDEPSKDCPFIKEEIGQCSIDTAKEYNPDLDVHFSSGVYNHAFYLLSTSEGWNVKKAFDLMVQANRFYWTANSTFLEGACGVLKAAKDYKYDIKTVVNVFKNVGIDTDLC
ncbi:MAG: Zinc metalloproteinase [Legionella sp.]|uniref:M4 family metallopeptidase n=1 Tax=Legionella sp. TaxID=459 RepID=UPI003D0EBAE0